MREDERTFRRVFDTLDSRNTGTIEKDEWLGFVGDMARERLRYLRVQGHLQGRCYWGRGEGEGGRRPEEGETRTCLEAALGAVLCWTSACCPYPPGYVEDLAFYTANNHPLLSTFFRDQDHPYSRVEQLLTLFCLNAYSLYVSVELSTRLDRFGPSAEQYAWTFGCISAPLLVLSQILFYLLACPCVKYERMGRKRECVFYCCETVFEAVGHLLVVPIFFAACALLVLAIICLANNRRVAGEHINGGDVLQTYAQGMVGSWCLWPLLVVCRQFCLWGARPFCCATPLRLAGVGQWAIERQRALDRALADAGDDDKHVASAAEMT